MPILHVDVRQLTGDETLVGPEDGQVWLSPYTAYHVEDGAEDYLVSTEKLQLRLVDGVADPEIPETPINNLMKAQLRGIRGYGAPWYFQMPGTDANLFDLPHIDPDTLDPETPPSPAWLAALEGVQDELGDKANTADVYDKTASDSRYATTAQGTKADSAVQPAGLTKAAVGLGSVDNTADSAKPVSTAQAAAIATKADKGVLSSLPVWVYGNSYTIDNPPNATAGKEWHKQLPTKIGAGTVTTYGISGTRIFDVCAALINQAAFSGMAAPIAGSRWPGTSSRTGLIVIDAAFNDHGHYPDMTVGLAAPTALSSNNRYLNGVIGAYRAALALASSETRIEQTSAVLSGTWPAPASAASYSGGSVSFTTTAGSAATFTVTPPQSGPLAGKVYLLTYKVEAALGTMAQIAISVDGGAATNVTPAAWEQYKGSTGAQVNVVPDCIAVTVPVDGASHSVAFTHAGSAGQFMYADALLIPSTTPNPIAVMERTTAPNAVLFTAPQVAVWRQNSTVIQAAIRNVVAEFGNAYSVASTLTSNGLYSADGIHPNDRGMEQILNDLYATTQVRLLAFMRNREQQLRPDADFAKV